jgi:hypothetical protein
MISGPMPEGSPSSSAMRGLVPALRESGISSSAPSALSTFCQRFAYKIYGRQGNNIHIVALVHAR